MVPKTIFLTKGVGVHKEKLVSFEEALRNAGIAPYNLVKVSSIFPPYCELVDKDEGISKMRDGSIVFCVLSENASNEPNRMLSASVGLAIPADNSKHGYISEHHSFGQNAQVVGDYAEDLAAYMLATTLGISSETSVQWDENKEIWKLNKEIVKTSSITQSATVDTEGNWTTVIACAVMSM